MISKEETGRFHALYYIHNAPTRANRRFVYSGIKAADRSITTRLEEGRGWIVSRRAVMLSAYYYDQYQYKYHTQVVIVVV